MAAVVQKEARFRLQVQSPLLTECSQHRGRLRPERAVALLPPFSKQPRLKRPSQLEIAHAQICNLLSRQRLTGTVTNAMAALTFGLVVTRHDGPRGTLGPCRSPNRQREPSLVGRQRLRACGHSLSRSECLGDVRRVEPSLAATQQRSRGAVAKGRAGVGVRPARRPPTPGRIERSDYADPDRQGEPSRVRLPRHAFRMPSRRAPSRLAERGQSNSVRAARPQTPHRRWRSS